MAKVNKVLIVDDDTIVRFLLRDLIQDLGLAEQVVEACNGAEGLQYLVDNCMQNDNCPEIIFLDIRMPEIDGFEFLNLKESLPAINKLPSKIIMFSSSAREDEIEKAKELGAIDYLIKPLTEKKLLETFEKIYN